MRRSGFVTIFLGLCGAAACTRQGVSAQDAGEASPRATAMDAATPGPDAVRGGMTEPELLAFYRDAAADDDARGPQVESPRLAADLDFAGTEPVDVVRASYRIALPDEVATIDTERALRVDDQGDRASAMLIGTGLPTVPGTRVAARNGYAGLALVSPDGSRYRVATPDDAQHWFLGASSRATTSLTFHRTDTTVLATRGGLSILLSTPAEGDRHPLTCRIFVAMILGGDAAAARLGCADARMPTRVSVRARGWPSITFERTASAAVQLPRRGIALPPVEATMDYTVPTPATDGAFFAPTELAALPGRHEPRYTLTATNGLTREALVLLDDLAIGWLAPGATATYVGLSGGPHHVRARSLDGLERSPNMPATLPATIAFVLDSSLR
ncbi:MAG: hypothetical protein WCJ30_04865 [Deltaproteobacteria bacterium]